MGQYEAYKKSNIQWVGDVPIHWKRHRIKYDLTRSAAGIWGDDEKGNESDIICYRIADYNYEKGIVDNDNPTVRNVELRQRVGRLLHAGDLLIEKSGGGDIWPVGRVVRYNLNNEAVCSNFIHSVSVDGQKIDKNFLYYYFRFLYANKVNLLYFNQTTGIQNLKVSAYLSQSIYAPELQEQRAIAGFLDDKCNLIDELIAKEEKRKDLLLELRKTVVSSLVTKGVGHAEEIIDSHVNSIGAVPKHWNICQIRRVLVSGKDGIKIGPFGSSLTGKVSGNGEYKVYGQWNIIDNDFSAGTSYIEKATFDELCPYQAIGGDILISMMGTVGKCAIIPENIQCGIMDSHVVKARLNPDKMDKDYFTLMYDKDNSDVVYAQINEVKKGSIMDGLNSSLIKSLRICMPPIEEQREIVAAVKEQTKLIDSVLEKADQRIKLLKEYKISLITEVVTGKRKVC